MKEKITFEDYLNLSSKLEIKIGEITSAERVPKSYGIKLVVDFGNNDIRSVFTNLGKTHEPSIFVGMCLPFITNLETSTIKGVDSEAMIMVGETNERLLELTNYSKGTKLL